MFCKRQVLQESVSVPTQSEMDVPTMLIYPNYSSAKLDQEEQWMSEAKDRGTGIQTCRTLIPTTVMNVPLRVLKILDTAVSLPKGTQVDQLQSVEVIEGFEQLSNDVSDGTLSSEGRRELKTLFNEFEYTLSTSDYDMGQTGITKHHIDTGDHPPFRQSLRYHPPQHLQAIKGQTDLMLQQGIIEPAVSGWTSNVVLVRKKNGSLRFCVDYLRLNEVCGMTETDAVEAKKLEIAGSRAVDRASGNVDINVGISERNKTID